MNPVSLTGFDHAKALPFDCLLNTSVKPSTIRGAKPDTGEVAERLNALVLKTSKGL